MIPSLGALVPNNTLQVTFDPLSFLACARTGIAPNAPERGRYAHEEAGA